MELDATFQVLVVDRTMVAVESAKSLMTCCGKRRIHASILGEVEFMTVDLQKLRIRKLRSDVVSKLATYNGSFVCRLT